MHRDFIKKLVILPTLLLTTTLTLTNCSAIETQTLTNELKNMEGVNEVQTPFGDDHIVVSVQPGFKVEQFNKIKCNTPLNIQQNNPKIDLEIEQTYNSNKSVKLPTTSGSKECEKFEQEDLDAAWDLIQNTEIEITQIVLNKWKNSFQIKTPTCYDDYKKTIQENITLLEMISKKKNFEKINQYKYCLKIELDRTKNQPTDPNSYLELAKVLKVLDKNNVHANVKMDDMLVTISTQPGTGVPDTVLKELENTYPELTFKDTTEKP